MQCASCVLADFPRPSPTMKTSLFIGAALATLLVSGISNAATTSFTATLNTAQEVGGVTGAGTGTVTATLDDVAGTLTGTGTYSGLTGDPSGGAHVHIGALCGANSNNIKTVTT